MTIAAGSTITTYNGSGSTGPFSFSWPIQDETDLALVKVTAGVSQALVHGADYSVAGVGNPAGGSVTLAAALNTGTQLFINSAVPYDQPLSIRDQGAFYPDVLEDALDRVTMQIKQLHDASVNGGSGAGGAGSISTVFGRTGAVAATPGDYTADQIAETAGRVFISPAQKTALSNVPPAPGVSYAAAVSISAATVLTSAAFGNLHVISGTSADYAITLPAASAGKCIQFKVAASATRLFTLNPGSATIDLASSRILAANDTCTLYCDGTNWLKVDGHTVPLHASSNITTAQSLAYQTWETMAFTTAGPTNAPAAMTDLTNKKLVCLRSGIYRATLKVFTGNSVGGLFGTNIHKNGSNITGAANIMTPTTSGSPTLVVHSTILSLTAGDYLQGKCFVNNNTWANAFINGQTEFNLEELSPW